MASAREGDGMRRREFIAILGGAAAAWPLGARAQQPGKIYRVGLLSAGPAMGALDERRKTLLSALAAKVSSKTVPIVVTGAGDPVATGLVDGLARPGGNLTGVTELSTELSAKRLEILKDAVPDLRRVAMLWNAADLGMTIGDRAADLVARSLRGARPADLPLELPTRFEFLINLKTAQVLGLALPPTLL